MTDRELAALIAWLTSKTAAGRLEWYETGVDSFTLVGDAGTVHLRRLTHDDQENQAVTSDSLILTSPAGEIYRKVGRTWPARTPSTPAQLLEAGRDTAFVDSLDGLFRAVRSYIEPEDHVFDLTDFVNGFSTDGPTTES